MVLDITILAGWHTKPTLLITEKPTISAELRFFWVVRAISTIKEPLNSWHVDKFFLDNIQFVWHTKNLGSQYPISIILCHQYPWHCSACLGCAYWPCILYCHYLFVRAHGNSGVATGVNYLYWSNTAPIYILTWEMCSKNHYTAMHFTYVLFHLHTAEETIQISVVES